MKGCRLVEADKASKTKVKKSAEVELGYEKTGPHVNLTFGISNTQSVLDSSFHR